MKLPPAEPTELLHQAEERLFISIVPVTLSYRPFSAEEEALVLDATALRRAQFAAGRRAARLAMAPLGVAPVAIGRGQEGEPLFPAQVCGSISHTREYAAAIVGWANNYASVGVDIDDGRPLGEEAAAAVTWKSEVKRIQKTLGIESAALAENFAFSAKEAVFKCQYPLTLNATLTQKQARLLARLGKPDALGVMGWRVRAATARVLEHIFVRRLKLAGQAVAIAVAKGEKVPQH